MVKEAVTYKRWSNSPPLQPFASRYADSYQECQLSWNPYCIKKDALFYQFRVGDNEDTTNELIPDACMNVLFELDESSPRALFSGTFLSSKTLTFKPGATYFGFKPYSNLGIKSTVVLPRELPDSAVDFAYAFPSAERLIEDLIKAERLCDRACIFTRFASENLIDDGYLPTFIDYLTIMICSSYGRVPFNDIYHDTGYSERYCREMFKDYYGIPPKQYGDIIRFQNAMKLLVSGAYEELSSLAIDGGYFDQSHLTHSFRRYVNTTPERYLRSYRMKDLT